MKQLFTVLTITFFVLISPATFSQQDTLFWFAAPDMSSGEGESPIQLKVMSYDLPSDITISQPANGGFVPILISIGANSSQNIDLTAFLAQIESPSGNAVNSNGLKITATNPISAYYEVNSATNKEIFTLKGNTALGMEFYAPFQKNRANAVTTPGSFSSFEIIASEDNTTVLITPRTAITGHAQNVTFSITLNEGQTYSARDMNLSAVTTLAGSIVSSNKPVCVTVFEGALINGACNDAIGDQITNSTYIGKNHVIHKGTATTDRIYILATQNSTALTITNSGTNSSLINWGETYELAINDDITYVSSSKPIYVMHVSGFGCELSSAQVPNVYCAGKYETAFSRSNSDSLGVILYTRSGYENQFTLNGNPALIPPVAFNNVPGTSGALKVARIFFNTTDVPVNSYNLIENTGDIFGMGLIGGDSGSGATYGYLSEFKSESFVDAGLSDTVCSNVDFPINGFIGGGPITGIWSNNGYGSFSNPTNSLSNTYVPSSLDVFISPVRLILTSTGECPSKKDTIFLYVNPQPMVSASADQTVCSNNSVVNLNGSIQGGATTGIWTVNGTGTFSPADTVLNATYTPSANDLLGAQLTFVLTSTNNGSCVAESDTMQLTFTQPAVVNTSVDTIYVCGNNPTVNLSGTVSGSSSTGKWITSGNGNFSPNNVTLSTTYNPTVSDIAGGMLTIYLESTSNGNCLPIRDSVMVIFTSSPIVDAGLNQIICTNNSEIQLAGSVTGATTTGIWTGGAGGFNSSSSQLNAVYTPTAAEISSGNLVLTLTSTNNGTCNQNDDVLQIAFVAPPFANFTAPDACLTNQTPFTNLSLPGFGSITNSDWDFDDLNQSTLLSPTHTYTQNGIFNVELIVTNSNGCTDTIVKPVEIFDKPIAEFSFTSNCPNNQVTISFTDESTSSDVIDYWYYGFGGQGNSTQQNPVQNFNSQGNYSITHIVSTENGCSDTIIEALQVGALPVAGFSYNTTNGLNVGAVFNFVDTSDFGVNYLWEFGNTSQSSLQNPSYTYFENGNYLVTQYVYNALGCYDSASVWIIINTVTTEINTLIPNAISPNGDGKNDVWKLDFINLLFPNATVEIYNQWGQRLFYSEGYDTPWNGKYNEEDVPDGNYYYVINLNANLETDIFKGALLVLKQAK
ncbi:MAG: PKD domain-containing protein [Crocinitomicaceae bacterium]